jgi:hypothetical protein
MEFQDFDSCVTVVIYTFIIPTHVAVAFAEPIYEIYPILDQKLLARPQRPARRAAGRSARD